MNKWLERSRRMIGCGAECHTMGCTCRLYAAALAAAHKEGWEAAIQAGERLLAQVADEYDDTEVGNAAADAFNALSRQAMTVRLQAWNAEIAKGLRALSYPDPVEKEQE